MGKAPEGQPVPEEKPLSFKQAAERFGICENGLRRAVREGLLAVFYAHDNARPKLLPSEIRKYMARQTWRAPQPANYTEKSTYYKRVRTSAKDAEKWVLPRYRGGVGE